jgi:hypothetical protein
MNKPGRQNVARRSGHVVITTLFNLFGGHIEGHDFFPNEEEDDVDDVRVGVKLKQRDVLPSPEFGAKFRNFITKEQLVSVPNCFSRLAK